METYFVLPHVGEMTLEHIFYMLDGEPILFVCKDPTGHRYLCSCCLMYEKWVIGQTEESVLLNLIDDKITIRAAFETGCNSKFLVSWDGKKFALNDKVSDDVLPKVGATLELEQEKTGPYRETLRRNLQQRILSQVLEADQLENLDLQEHIQMPSDFQKLSSVLPVLTEHIKGAAIVYDEILSLSGTMRRLDDTDNICNLEKTEPVLEQSLSVETKGKQKSAGQEQVTYRPNHVDCFAA